MEWKLADAKNKFSEVFTRAMTTEPQRIIRRDEVAILLSEDEYRKLKGERKDFIQFLLDGPNLSDLDLTRDRSPMRDVDL